MGDKQPYCWRFYFVLTLFCLCFLTLLWRIVDLAVLKRGFLQKQSDVRTIRTIKIHAHRGIITDRNGVPLAISVKVDSVWVNPQICVMLPQQIRDLSRLLKIPQNVIRRKIRKRSKGWFVYLKRRINPTLADQVKNLDIYGLFLQPEYKRYYPEGEVTAHVLGFTNVDDHGQEGLELLFNNWLSGTAGKKRVLKDRLGHIIANMETVQKPQKGRNLILSLDYRIQYNAYYALKKAVEKYHADSGSVVVLDAKTGEILAMVNQPSFNPNNRSADINGRYRNRAITDVFEPGSTMKTFSIASALASGKYGPNTKINTSPGWMMIDGNEVHDEHVNHGVLTVTGVLQKSSNVGVAKMMLSLPHGNLWTFLYSLGFGARTASGFPGEATGRLVNHRVWRPFVLATLAFGYAISVTPLQLAHAYATIASGGVKRPVTFLKVAKPLDNKRVITKKVAVAMLRMLESVVKVGGTGKRARIPGYTVAGKTGTANIAGSHGYNKKQHIASFVGIAPATRPQLVVAVVLRNPRRQHFGGLVAAPVFASVMHGALQTMGVPPDKVN